MEQTLIIIDIDGCIVEGFDGKGLNEGAFAERLAQQPINENIVKLLNQELDSTSCHWLHGWVVTGRKAYRSAKTTEAQLKPIVHLIDGINYYPMELGYEPFSQYVDWKVGMIQYLVDQLKPERTIIIEDSIDVCKAVYQQVKFPFLFPKVRNPEYWFILKNRYLMKMSEIME